MSETLTNEEIREKLLKFKPDCGPVTDTTRQIHLKTLESLQSKTKTKLEKSISKLTDYELRSQLIALGESPAPITKTNKRIYEKRLEEKKGLGNNYTNHVEYTDGCEPMDVD